MAGFVGWLAGLPSAGQGTLGSTWRRLPQSFAFRHLLLALFFLALVIRLVHFLSILSTPLVTYHRTFAESDMYDFDQWALRIVNGDFLGRQIYHPVHQWQLTGAPIERWRQWYGSAPVFFKAPLYPYLIALLYWLFGEALLPLALLQIVASTLAVLLVFRIGERLFDRVSGFLAGLLYALYGPAVHYDVFMLRSSLIVFMSLVVTWQLIELRSQPTLKRACVLGLTTGMALLLNEGFFMLLPLVVVLMVWWFQEVRRLAVLGGALLVGLAIASAPLVVRNLMVGVPPLSLAVTGSTNVAVFNAADASPNFFLGTPPSFLTIMDQSGGGLVATVWACMRSFQGDIGAPLLFYVRKAIGLTIPFEDSDNANFYYAALKGPLLRFLPGYAVLFPLSVVGLALAARRPRKLEALFPAALSLLIGIMITLPNSRFRSIFAVYLTPFAGLAATQGILWLKGRRFLPLAAGAGACLLISVVVATLQQRVVFRGLPADAFRYRPTEFWIGAEVYTREKRYREATEELLQLVQRNPDGTTRSWALLMLAKSLAREGHKAEARRSVEVASTMNGDDPLFLMQVGDFHWQTLNDIPPAIVYYRRAMSLQPPAALSVALRQRLDRLEESPALQKDGGRGEVQ